MRIKEQETHLTLQEHDDDDIVAANKIYNATFGKHTAFVLR